MARPFRDPAARRGEEVARYDLLRIYLDRAERGADSFMEDMLIRFACEVMEQPDGSFHLAVWRLDEPQWRVLAVHPKHNEKKRWAVTLTHSEYANRCVYPYPAHFSAEFIAGAVSQILLSLEMLDKGFLQDKLF